MQITPAVLDGIYSTFDTRFQAGRRRADPWYSKLAMEIPSTSRESRYAWAATIPALREWVGERYVHNLAARGQVIPNKDWELTIEVDRNDIEDDQVGIFTPALDNIGYQAAKWPDRVLKTVLQAGTSTAAWDGQWFFDTDHPVDFDSSAAGTYQNLYTGTALTPANFATIRANMMSRLDERGDSLEVYPDTLIVPPQLEYTGRVILNSEIIAPGAAWSGNASGAAATNVYRNSATLLVIPELSNEPTVWYLAQLNAPLKPFVFQMRKRPQFQQFVQASDGNVFWHKKLIYGVDARGNAGYTMPFLISRCIA